MRAAGGSFQGNLFPAGHLQPAGTKYVHNPARKIGVHIGRFIYMRQLFQLFLNHGRLRPGSCRYLITPHMNDLQRGFCPGIYLYDLIHHSFNKLVYRFTGYIYYIVVIKLGRHVLRCFLWVNQPEFFGRFLVAFIQQPLVTGFHGHDGSPGMTWHIYLRDYSNVSLSGISQNLFKLFLAVVAAPIAAFKPCYRPRSIGRMQCRRTRGGMCPVSTYGCKFGEGLYL